ncbi:transposase [Trueperella abortisuis]
MNARNGSYTKTVASEVGDIELTIARDREGSLSPPGWCLKVHGA